MINKNNHLMLPISGQSAVKTTFSRIAGLVLVIAATLLSSSICSASVTNVYIAQNATGAANGADCADALPLTWLNTSGNWGANANQVGPGSTAHLCGTFTGAAGGQAIVVNGSGSSGDPITIKFETNAVLTSPYWSVFGAIRVTGKSWIVIDGGTNGIIQNTDNGSTLANQQASTGMHIDGTVSNIIVKNVTIANIYQHTTPTDTTGGGSTGGITLEAGSFTNVTITQNTIHDGNTALNYYGAAGDSGIVFSHNTLYRNNWGWGGATIGGTSNGLLIDSNDISCVVGAGCNWTDNANGNHHNGIMMFPQGAADVMQGVTISNNFIHDINPCTAFIFLDVNAGDIPGAKVFNNVFFTTSGQAGPANGSIVAGIGDTGMLALNNTLVGPSGAGVGGQVNPTIKNNIIIASSYGFLINAGYTGLTSDYNAFFNLQSVNDQMFVGGFFASVADYVAATGQDTHGITTNPNLSASFMLNTGSPAIGKGVNLTSLGIPGLNIGAPQTFGVGGTCGTGCIPRPSTGPWDMGAYPHNTNLNLAQVAPPTGVTAVGH